MNLLSLIIDNVKEKLDNKKKIIKIYKKNNTALSTRNKMLNKKIEEQNKTINELEVENSKFKANNKIF